MTTQEWIYKYIEQHIADEGFAPAYRTICTSCGIAMGVLTYHLDKLEAQGYITRQPRKTRSIQLTEKKLEVSTEHQVIDRWWRKAKAGVL
jgi:repressor LexA